ncbi:hypothetical protein [Ruminiclostridium cellobioparum]|uniref:hypothetical protein n=1 Tax=Ruminiclostridium cellobioparum TaxID=29355 RepID=UPI0028ADCF55|nr:hypothetical protein [Ruminiclostridium cellobioparum]
MNVDRFQWRVIIKPISKSFAKKEAIARLCGEWITEERVDILFEKVWRNLQYPHKSVWLTYSKTELIEECGHYIIYGSEFICGMAAELFCQSNLKLIGIPTIFYCDIPLENVPESYLDEIGQMLIDKSSEGGFRVIDKIRPEEIVDCIHPMKIHDPLTWTTYIYKG